MKVIAQPLLHMQIFPLMPKGMKQPDVVRAAIKTEGGSTIMVEPATDLKPAELRVHGFGELRQLLEHHQAITGTNLLHSASLRVRGEYLMLVLGRDPEIGSFPLVYVDHTQYNRQHLEMFVDEAMRILRYEPELRQAS